MAAETGAGGKCPACGGKLDEEGICTSCGRNSAVFLTSEREDDLRAIINWLSDSAGTVTLDVENEENREQELSRKLDEAQATIRKLEIQLQTYEMLVGNGSKEVAANYSEILKAKQETEDKLKELEEEIASREVRIRELESELRRIQQEAVNREAEWQQNARLLQEEMAKLQAIKNEMGTENELNMKRALEDLKEQIRVKEEKLRDMEDFLRRKEDELAQREKQIIGKELDAFQEVTLAEIKQERVKSGIKQLDNLLMGGIPVGSQILITGPTFIGKEVAVNQFAAEAIRKGTPLVWITADRSIDQIRTEMSFVISNFGEYETRGLIRFIDLYSASVGEERKEQNVTVISDYSDIDAIERAVDGFLTSLGDVPAKRGYRVVFRTISAMTAVMEVKELMKMLRSFVARRKRDKAVSMYCIDAGLMEPKQVQAVAAMMDGVIEFDSDTQGNKSLLVKGITKTATSDRVGYTFTGSGLMIGSFSIGRV